MLQDLQQRPVASVLVYRGCTFISVQYFPSSPFPRLSIPPSLIFRCEEVFLMLDQESRGKLGSLPLGVSVQVNGFLLNRKKTDK